MICNESLPLKSQGSAAVPKPVTVTPGRAVSSSAAVALKGTVALSGVPPKVAVI